MTTHREVGALLEDFARQERLITYGEIVKQYPDLPENMSIWKAHPLCYILGELDDEDHRNHHPLRSALVVTKEHGMPGNGFFETITNLRGTKIDRSQRPFIWSAEVKRVFEHFAKR